MEGVILTVVLVALAVPVALVIALAQIASLRTRIERLETALSRQISSPAPARSAEGLEGMGQVTPSAAAAVDRPQPTPPAATMPATPAAVPARPAPAPATPQRPDLADIVLARIRRWFSEGNVPVKVGMLVLFAGVAALMKYAADQGWLTLPLEVRLSMIAAAALAGLVFGWRQRHARPAFALSLQGGAIGILLMLAFASFRVFGVLPGTASFAIATVLVAGAGVLAVVQHARSLAVLAILGGFLAPVLVATGAGSHIALFAYYGVLNLGILAVAWFRPWRELNLLGFVFTFGIGVAWGVLEYSSELRASTLPFLAGFFLLYAVIPVLYALRSPASRVGRTDAALVFATPLVSFGVLAALLDVQRLPLALTALGLGAAYTAAAWQGLRRVTLRPLGEAWAVLGAGFATLAIPLAFSARVTASLFALEGAALLWFGLRHRNRLAHASGIGLQVLAGGILLIGLDAARVDPPLANPAALAIMLVALAAFVSAWSAFQHARAWLAAAAFFWGLGWWLVGGFREIGNHALDSGIPAFALLLFALTLAGCTALGAPHVFRAARQAVVGSLAAVVLVHLVWAVPGSHPFEDLGLLAMVAVAIAGLWALRVLAETGGQSLTWAMPLWWLGWSIAISMLLRSWAQSQGLGDGWVAAASALPWLLVLAALLDPAARIGWPAHRVRVRWHPATLHVFIAAAVIAWGWLCMQPGATHPLPWIPVLNPTDLAMLAAFALVVLATRPTSMTPHALRMPVLSLMGLATASILTLRSVHHLTGAPWSSAILDTAAGQAGLSLVWSVLGVVAWVLGSRRRDRMLWRAGAILMGVVLVKLVLVDRQHLGNLAGIASFIGYGLLCTVVGYLAPVPPRAAEPAPHAEPAR